jgi:ribosome biogenesis protein ENP2
LHDASQGNRSYLADGAVKHVAEAKEKRAAHEHIEGTIELIQHFESPEASIRIMTTCDGHHAISTGTYKPQMRVWDLVLKFEHADIENIDFIVSCFSSALHYMPDPHPTCLSQILFDNWTKTLHLQVDRIIELHTQGGIHYCTQIPHFGRALAYHFQDVTHGSASCVRESIGPRRQGSNK